MFVTVEEPLAERVPFLLSLLSAAVGREDAGTVSVIFERELSRPVLDLAARWSGQRILCAHVWHRVSMMVGGRGGRTFWGPETTTLEEIGEAYGRRRVVPWVTYAFDRTVQGAGIGRTGVGEAGSLKQVEALLLDVVREPEASRRRGSGRLVRMVESGPTKHVLETDRVKLTLVGEKVPERGWDSAGME